MVAAKTVTFELPSGSKVTCSEELAEKLGHKPTPTAKKAIAAKPKSDD